MVIVRKFCLYRRRTVPDCFVPDSTLFPTPGQTVTPYIFSEAEIARLMRAASSLQRSPYSPLRPEVVRLAVVLLYTTGLRIGELLRLVVGDIDPREGTAECFETDPIGVATERLPQEWVTHFCCSISADLSG